MRRLFIAGSAATLALIAAVSWVWPPVLWSLVVVGPLVLRGIADIAQTRQAVRRNFPVIGHGRYLLEQIRPEINQYFVESNSDGRPFSRNDRSVVYQRAKGELDTLPFGTQRDVYAAGYEWINHSLAPVHPRQEAARVTVGGPACRQPYSASILNVSAMSYGSLSKNAVLALNAGAKIGGFAHNTGEGGLSPYHLEPGGDLVWQIGTGYFSCRTPDGRFDPDEFARRATLPNVKMIEVKLSQGAKPGHGGILPAAKLTPEIVAIRGVVPGQDVISPPAHTAFSTPLGLLQFLQVLRDGSGGKPVGFKLCVGKRHEFLGIVKAMLESGIVPDFITVDGGEGGTGAAPLEFSDSIGTPLNEGLAFVHNALVGVGLRDQVRLVASGKVNTGFQLATKVALGADMCNAARAMMFALGCIQALRCNTNQCPTGVATQDPELVHGLHVGDKSERVARYHRETVKSFFEVLGAAGLHEPGDLKPWFVMRRVTAAEVRSYNELYPPLEPGSLLTGEVTPSLARAWATARADAFNPPFVQSTKAARPTSRPTRQGQGSGRRRPAGRTPDAAASAAQRRRAS
ncbi:MAG: FMN-binding glutamate synthase family protein [Vicinamibacterales bacterium]